MLLAFVIESLEGACSDKSPLKMRPNHSAALGLSWVQTGRCRVYLFAYRKVSACEENIGK